MTTKPSDHDPTTHYELEQAAPCLCTAPDCDADHSGMAKEAGPVAEPPCACGNPLCRPHAVQCHTCYSVGHPGWTCGACGEEMIGPAPEPPRCGSPSHNGQTRCTQPLGHGSGWHDDGRACWPVATPAPVPGEDETVAVLLKVPVQGPAELVAMLAKPGPTTLRALMCDRGPCVAPHEAGCDECGGLYCSKHLNDHGCEESPSARIASLTEKLEAADKANGALCLDLAAERAARKAAESARDLLLAAIDASPWLMSHWNGHALVNAVRKVRGT